MTRIRLRRGEAAEWAATNPVLLSGEAGVDVDSHRMKLGDGVSTWTALPYADVSSLTAFLAGAPVGLNEWLELTAAITADQTGLAALTTTVAGKETPAGAQAKVDAEAAARSAAIAALSSTYVAKGSLVVNAKDYATGDGTTNDAVALQTAADAAAGGVLYIPKGIFLTATPISITTGTTVLGAGRGSVIKASASLGNVAVLINKSQAPANDAARDQDIVIQNVRVDGNRANNAGGSGSMCIRFTSVYRCAVVDCWLDSPDSDGVYVGGQGGVTCEQVVVRGNWIYDAARNGVSIISCKGARVIGNTVKGCLLCGIDLEPDGATDFLRDCLVADNLVDSCDRGINYDDRSVNTTNLGSNRISRNTVRNSTNTGGNGRGIYGLVDGGFLTIDNNEVDTTADHGIEVGAGSSDFAVRGNTVRNTGGTFKRPILISAGCARFSVSGNNIVSATSSCIVIASGDRFRVVDNTLDVNANGIVGIALTDCTNGLVSGNTFSANAAGSQDAVDLLGTCLRVTITGNDADGFANGVYLAAATGACRIVANGLEGCTTPVNGAGDGTNLILANTVVATTAAELLTLIKTVDGSGSGLDADLLDGHDTAYFEALTVGLNNWLTGRYYYPQLYGLTTTQPGNTHGVACPILVPNTVTIDRIGCEVTTAVASSTVRLGIYAGTAGLAGAALVLDAGTIDSSTTGAKEITISQALPAGRYWLVAVIQGTGSPTLRGFRGISSLVGTSTFSPDDPGVWSGFRANAWAAGALPGTAPAITNVTTAPVIGVRVA